MVTAGAVLVATLTLPGTAHAAGPNVKEATSNQSDWSVLDVRLNYSGGIDKITARLRPVGSSDTDEPVATISDFTKRYEYSSWDAVWASQPIHLDTLGDYTVDIEATESDGETTVEKNAGTLHYQKQPVFTGFAVTPAEPDIEHQTFTAGGDMVVRDPSTRETVPLPGATVNLTFDGGSAEATAVTDEAGHFSAPHRLAQSGWVFADYNGGLGFAASPWIDVRPKAAPTRLVLDKSSFHVTAGDKVDVTGTLQYQIGEEWKPLPGIPLEMDYKECTTCSPVGTTTDANGRFSFVRTPYGPKSVYEVTFASYTPFAQHSTADITVAVTATTKFSEFTAQLDKYAQLDVTGSVDLVGRDTNDRIAVDIQYSPDGKTGWTTKKTVQTSNGAQFVVEELPGYPDGYWRLHYAGSTTKDIKGGVSNSLHRYRALTRVKDANASPEPVTKGRTITVKGVLQERAAGSSTWKAYGAKKVQILFRPKGAKTWYVMSTVTSKSNGSFSKGFTARQDGTWVPVFLYPDSKHFVGSGREDYVDVR
ncbi:carboxypeptidase regulatory-like domain-containing protein [Streptomyces actinomycinicus]|uniref:Carboxypeptidase regulatory-like domain-containing protein n=2 Tax=Streptomyces actinomycinicus TaxID=1695166 RepID=A0A937EK21_9ACTN|nr:carboxypeptidase regulatory-like domain-containing protein [Streptomyces actinomycinicus]